MAGEKKQGRVLTLRLINILPAPLATQHFLDVLVLERFPLVEGLVEQHLVGAGAALEAVGSGMAGAGLFGCELGGGQRGDEEGVGAGRAEEKHLFLLSTLGEVVS